MTKVIFIGYDPREQDAFEVCAKSIVAHQSEEFKLVGVSAGTLHEHGLYQRPTERRDGVLWDVISNAPMATEFSIARFAVPYLVRQMNVDWAMFCDCDFMFRADLASLFAEADPRYALQCVQHQHEGGDTVKMDGQIQTSYERKNWSSLFLLNAKHPANAAMNLAKLNSWSGRALHQFKWLEDSEIGKLSPDWNYLVGVNDPNPDPRGVHFTLGIPSMEGYEYSEFADEWQAYANGTAC